MSLTFYSSAMRFFIGKKAFSQDVLEGKWALFIKVGTLL
jgi:hypothetical protein